MIKRLVLYSALVLISAGLSYGQCVGSCTTVTATLQDSSTQVWANATVTATIIPPFGNPNPLLNNGSPIASPTNTINADGSGAFSISLDNNVNVTPANSQWRFTICPNATVQNCSSLTLTITGASMNISTQINTILIIPTVNTSPTIWRAYSDSEALGGQGSVYWRTSDNTFRGCPLTLCTGSGWAAIGAGGGTGTVTNFVAPTGFGVSGNGTSTITLTMPSSWTTGDILIGNGSNSVARLGIGANNTVLTSNGTTFSWVAVATGTITGATANGGLVVTGTTLGLLKTCSNNQILQWDTTAWNCATVSGTGTLTGSGTSGTIPIWTGTSALGNSNITFSASVFSFANGINITSGQLSLSGGGRIQSYNGNSTVGNGVTSIVGDQSGSTFSGNMSPTTIFTVPSTGTYLYRVDCYLVLQSAGGVSSTLPSCQASWTDAATGIVETATFSNTSISNTIGTIGGGVLMISPNNSTTVTVSTTGYVSSGGSAMSYMANFKLEKM